MKVLILELEDSTRMGIRVADIVAISEVNRGGKCRITCRMDSTDLVTVKVDMPFDDIMELLRRTTE